MISYSELCKQQLQTHLDLYFVFQGLRNSDTEYSYTCTTENTPQLNVYQEILDSLQIIIWEVIDELIEGMSLHQSPKVTVLVRSLCRTSVPPILTPQKSTGKFFPALYPVACCQDADRKGWKLFVRMVSSPATCWSR